MNDTHGDNEPEIIFKSTRELVRQAIQQIEDRYEQQKKGEKLLITGIPTGFADIDKVTCGLPYGISVAGARPEDGLTDFGLNIALNASETHKVAYISPDIPSPILMKRLIHISSRTNMSNLNEGFLAERDFPKLTGAAGKLGLRDNFSFYDGRMDHYRFLEVCKCAQDKNGAQFIVLDRFQSLFPRENSGESFYWTAKEISGVLHDRVAERGLALLILSELKKKGRERICSDHLRDFGVFEYEARPIILLERAQYDDDGYCSGQGSWGVSARITNNLAGEINADVPLTYFATSGKFESAAKISDE